MANPKHLKILEQGAEAWNEWRLEHPAVYPKLTKANLERADLAATDFSEADLSRAILIGANLSHADLSRANLFLTDLTDADLTNAVLGGADLIGTNLRGANLRHAILIGASLRGADLIGADFSNAMLGNTTLADNDLSEVKGLETARYYAPSSISIDTLYKSAGKIPEAFLRGCGVPDDFIAFIPSHFGVQQAIQFYSCFISYSTKDEKLRVWFAPEEMKGGQKIYDQIERAIQMHDRLLIVLSENSLQSKWVVNEIRRARKVELKEKRRKLFPIRLVDYKTLQDWECFDAGTGEDLAEEVRAYFIPDFSNWKEHDAFEQAFARLLRDLKDEETRAIKK